MYKFEAEEEFSSEVSLEDCAVQECGESKNSSASEFVQGTSSLVSNEDSGSSGISNNYKNDDYAATFFILVEKRVGQIPEYLKNMVFINGFAAPKLFENLSDSDLASMENFVKSVMPRICPLTPEYFSVFCQNVEEFKITQGHRNLLLSAVEKVKCESDALHKELLKEMLKKRQKTEARESCRLKTATGNGQEMEMASKIENKIRILTRQWCEKADLGNFDKKLIDPNKIRVKLVNSGQDLFAEVVCPICRHHIKIGIWTNKQKKNPRLILSNFNSHIRMHAKKENQKRVSSTTTNSTETAEDESVSDEPLAKRTRRSSNRLEVPRSSVSSQQTMQEMPKTLSQVYNGELIESISDFWMNLEMEFSDGEEIVPRYLQNFLHLMGFGTRKALSLLREDDFDILERYGRQKMKVWTDESESIEFFLGPFATVTDEFEIALGHKRQLIELKDSLVRQMERKKFVKDPIAEKEESGESSHFTQVLLKEYKSEDIDNFYNYE
ncbi:uncharacterized protein LOC132264117 [Phlebotomus argentipes]|uniref:uncharacterized protein LOC132264117 n=1 Tax=Phlebotomus argentipes TaxID=94469 RepID=UPI002893019F|nr:uncharacterized protein LOC132264117 [Phlebotomus argentipes]